jgi:hypothetical protein
MGDHYRRKVWRLSSESGETMNAPSFRRKSARCAGLMTFVGERQENQRMAVVNRARHAGRGGVRLSL